MSEEELLLQLRDIQAPPEPAWWLLAPGHLAVLGLVILLLGGGWLILRRRRANRLAKLAEYELQLIKSDFHHHKDPRQLATRLSCWLKQVALQAYQYRGGICGIGQRTLWNSKQVCLPHILVKQQPASSIDLFGISDGRSSGGQVR